MPNSDVFISSSRGSLRLVWRGLLALLALTLWVAGAQAKPSRSASPLDLMREAKESKLLIEESVQTEGREPHRNYGLRLGSFSGGRVRLAGAIYSGEYDFGTPREYVGFSFDDYFLGSRPNVGLHLGLGYTTRDSTNGLLTLYALPLTLGINFRTNELGRTALKLNAGMGLGTLILFQRGLEGANSSERVDLPYLQIGAQWSFSRLLNPNSMVPGSTYLEWRRFVGPSQGERNLQSDVLSLGLGVSL